MTGAPSILEPTDAGVFVSIKDRVACFEGNSELLQTSRRLLPANDWDSQQLHGFCAHVALIRIRHPTLLMDIRLKSNANSR